MPAMEQLETGHLIRALAHDFNNALHIVAGSVAALMDGSAAGEEEDVLQDASQATHQAIRLARLLQSIGRSLTLAQQPVVLSDVLDLVLAEIDAVAAPSEAPCLEQIAPLEVTGDARVLVECLTQLLLPLVGGPLYVQAGPSEATPPGHDGERRWGVVEAIATEAAAETWAALTAGLETSLEQTRLVNLSVTASGWILNRLGAVVVVDPARGRLRIYLPLAA